MSKSLSEQFYIIDEWKKTFTANQNQSCVIELKHLQWQIT